MKCSPRRLHNVWRSICLLLLTCISCIAQRLPSLIPYVDGDRWGYADSMGKVIIKPQWESAGFFKDGKAIVSMLKTSSESYYCLIDTTGSYIIPPSRHWNGKLYSKLVEAGYNAHGKDGWGIIDGQNREIIPVVYEKTDGMEDEAHWSGTFHYDSVRRLCFAVAKKGGKYGIIDTNNRTLIPFQYDGMFRVYSGWRETPPQNFTVVVNGKHGLIDTANRMIVPAVYEHIMFDANDYNKGMALWKSDWRMITDINGRIVIDIPGYSADFPQDSLIPVTKIGGRAGMMNYKHEVVIPCLYVAAWVQHDTIAVLRDSTYADGSSHWYHRYFSRKTFKPIGSWFTDPPPPKPVVVDRPTEPGEVKISYANDRLVYIPKMRLNGKEVSSFEKNGIVWRPMDYYDYASGCNSVTGISIKDSVTYVGMVDTLGQFLFPPRRSKGTIIWANTADKLLVLEYPHNDSAYCVTDYTLGGLIPYQKNKIVTTFRYQDKVYAIIDIELGRGNYWLRQNMDYYHRQSSYRVVGENGNLLDQYGLLWSCDNWGCTIDSKYSTPSIGNFRLPFAGYFTVEDKEGKVGIVRLDGTVMVPDVSFRYEALDPRGGGIFIVQKYRPRPVPYEESQLISILQPEKPKPVKGIYYGEPYAVNAANKVLLDSMTVESIISDNVTPDGGHNSEAATLFFVHLQQEPGKYEDRMIIMDAKGHGYYGLPPGTK